MSSVKDLTMSALLPLNERWRGVDELQRYGAALSFASSRTPKLLEELSNYQAFAKEYVIFLAEKKTAEASAKAAKSAKKSSSEDKETEDNSKVGSDDWWSFRRKYCLQLATWYEVATEVALVFTSSACVERVFSLYDTYFGGHDKNCLEDRIEVSMQTRFNEIHRVLEILGRKNR
jgi:hypothetical protein